MSTTVTSTSATSASPAYTAYVPATSGTVSAALTNTAVSLAAQSSVVSLIGGGSGSSTYTAAGLLSSLQQAGTATETIATPVDSSNTDTSTTAQDAQDQSIVSGMSSTGSGVYSGTGTSSDGLSEAASANWASLLKTNPNLASTVISSSFTSGVVSTMLTSA